MQGKAPKCRVFEFITSDKFEVLDSIISKNIRLYIDMEDGHKRPPSMEAISITERNSAW